VAEAGEVSEVSEPGEAAAVACARGSRATMKMVIIHPTSAANGMTAMMTSCHTDRAEFILDMRR
jgi:hypothetical protein